MAMHRHLERSHQSTAQTAAQTAWLAIPFVLIWTSAFPAAKFVFLDSPPLLFLMVRFLCAGLLLTAWGGWRGDFREMRLRDLGGLVLLGGLNHALYLGLSWEGMGGVSSGLATIVISANPIVVAVLSAALLGEALTRRKLAGLALGFGGVAFIVRNRLQGGSDGTDGLVLVVLALLTLAAGTVLYKRLRLQVGFVGNVGLQMLLAGGLLAPVALWREDFADVRLTASLMWSFLWLLVVVSIGAYLLWFSLLKRASASAASAWLFLTPPLGLVASAAVLGEAVETMDFLGIVPVVLGIALVTREPAARSAREPKRHRPG